MVKQGYTRRNCLIVISILLAATLTAHPQQSAKNTPAFLCFTLDVNGNAVPCGAANSGSTGISGLTAGYIPLAGSASTITGNSHIDEVTNPGSETITQSIILACVTSSCPSQVALTYNSAAPPTVGTSTTAVYAVNSSGQAVASEAGAAIARICTATNGVCSSGGTSGISLNIPRNQFPQTVIANPGHNRWDTLGAGFESPFGGTVSWITSNDPAGFGGAQLTTGATANTYVGWNGGIGLISSNPSMKAIFGLGSTAGARAWVGFCASSCQNGSGMGTLNPATAGTNLIALRYFNGTDTNWTCYIGNGATSTTLDSGVAVSTTQQQMFDVIYVSGSPQLFIGGARVCSGISLTTAPSSTGLLSLIVAWQNSTTTPVLGTVQEIYEGEY